MFSEVFSEKYTCALFLGLSVTGVINGEESFENSEN